MFKLNSSATELLQINVDIPTAHNLFTQALDKIGSLKETEYTEKGLIMKGRSRFGLQSVSLDIKITTNQDKSLKVLITGKVLDVDATAARKCIDRLIEIFNAYYQNNTEQIHELEATPAFKRRTGFKLGSLIIIVLVFFGVLFLIESQNSSPSVYGIYKLTSDNSLIKEAVESQECYIELNKSGVIFYHAALSGLPNIENEGTYRIKDDEIHVNWASGKLPNILILEIADGAYLIRLPGSVYKK